MTEPTKLSRLAKELKLTARQKAFCELLSADPERNQRKAAEGAGYRKGAEVRASQLVRDPKIQQYLQAIVGEAVALAEKGAVMDASEGLEILTKQARMKYPWEVHRKNGKVYKPGLAVSRLLDHYEPKDKGAEDHSKTLIINLNGVPREELKGGLLGFLGQGDDGDRR